MGEEVASKKKSDLARMGFLTCEEVAYLPLSSQGSAKKTPFCVQIAQGKRSPMQIER